MYRMIEADLQDRVKTTVDGAKVKTLEYKPIEVGKIKTLESASIEDLIAEVTKRKNTIIPILVNEINKNIEMLRTLGIEIEDADDGDYIISKIKATNCNNGNFLVEYETACKR